MQLSNSKNLYALGKWWKHSVWIPPEFRTRHVIFSFLSTEPWLRFHRIQNYFPITSVRGKERGNSARRRSYTNDHRHTQERKNSSQTIRKMEKSAAVSTCTDSKRVQLFWALYLKWWNAGSTSSAVGQTVEWLDSEFQKNVRFYLPMTWLALSDNFTAHSLLFPWYENSIHTLIFRLVVKYHN